MGSNPVGLRPANLSEYHEPLFSQFIVFCCHGLETLTVAKVSDNYLLLDCRIGIRSEFREPSISLGVRFPLQKRPDNTQSLAEKANWVTRKIKLSSKVACLPIAFFESVAAFSLLLQIQDILFYFVSFFVGVARQLKRHSSASLEPVCMPNVHGLLRFCCHRTQQDKCPLHKKLGTLLHLCVSSLRRGHADLLCIVPILSDDPRRESGTCCPTASRRNTRKRTKDDKG